MVEEIKKATEVLRKGGVILYPTDTIWGLGCDATREDAVKKIFALKQRREDKSMLLLLDDTNKLTDYVDVPDIAWDILAVNNKPLTIIYPNARNLAESIIAEDGSVGIRIVNDEFCRKLIAVFGKPIVSTSANISGKGFATNFRSIDESIVKGVDHVVNWKQDDEYRGKPSGIIKLGIHGEVQVIRE